jgi:hypothetical protein
MGNFAKRLIRLATAAIPVKSVRRRIRQRLMDKAQSAWLAKAVPLVRGRYAIHERSCREKLARGESLKVCFLVCDASMFSSEPVFAKMKDDPRFDCFIAVVPRVTRGERFLRETYAKALETLRPRYGDAVRALYDPGAKTCEGLAGRADIVFTSIVYSGQSFECFNAMALSEFALVAYIPYGYGGPLTTDLRRTVFLPEQVLFWKTFLANEAVRADWARANRVLEPSLVVAGFAKMDRLADFAPTTGQKTVIISPHHTLTKDSEADGLALSNFLRYADFFLKLPQMFPDIHFVFRPHPLLFPRLATSAWWGETRTAAYREKMAALPNVEFQQGGDYFATFAESCALVHDCGSFVGEYTYTEKPQCYMLRDASTLEREFTPLGRAILDCNYPVYDERGIEEFLRTVVIGGADPKADARRLLARERVCTFHPHAAEQVVKELFP